MDHAMDEPDDVAQETPPSNVFVAPSIDTPAILAGESYTHFSEIPAVIARDPTQECVLGVDEAGRGPVLGPMVYALLYLPIETEKPLLADKHHFDDSKVLTPAVRSRLMQTLCAQGSDLHQACGWATRVMSARDISAGMLKAGGSYNLNAQAMDATIDLISETLARGVKVREIYIDTIGSPAVYQKKLEKIFPTTRITVAKKADSLYPCVSAASVCAKVTRDAALEASFESYEPRATRRDADAPSIAVGGWGSGYPSDVRCPAWLKKNMDPLFGWGSECRFSWATVKDMLETKAGPVKVDWPEDDDENSMKVTEFFRPGSNSDPKMNWRIGSDDESRHFRRQVHNAEHTLSGLNHDEARPNLIEQSAPGYARLEFSCGLQGFRQAAISGLVPSMPESCHQTILED